MEGRFIVQWVKARPPGSLGNPEGAYKKIKVLSDFFKHFQEEFHRRLLVVLHKKDVILRALYMSRASKNFSERA